MGDTDKLNLPDDIPGGKPKPQGGSAPIRVYGPAQPVNVVYGPASMPEPVKKERKKGFFENLKEKLEHPEPTAVYGPAEWFDAGGKEPVDVYGPAEMLEDPADVYGPAEPVEPCDLDEPCPTAPADGNDPGGGNRVTDRNQTQEKRPERTPGAFSYGMRN